MSRRSVQTPLPVGRDRISVRAGGVIVALAALLVYVNTLANDFALDDVPIVATNPNVTAPGPALRAWTTPYWPESNRGDRDDLLYRPLTIQTYRWQHAIHGPAAWPYHLVNILLHAAVSAGVWRLARRLGAAPGPALIASLLFAVHPIHTDAVSNIVGRAELLAGGFTLLAVLCALSAHQRRISPNSRSPWSWWIAAWGAAAAALAAKENGVAALALVAFVAAGLWTPPDAARKRITARQVAAALLPALVIFAAYLAIRYEVGGHRLTVLGQRVAVSNPLRDVDGVARWLTPPALLGRYVWLTLSPQRLMCDYSLNALPPVTTLADATFWLGLAFLAGCLFLGIRKSPRRPTWWLLLAGWAAGYFLASNSLLLIDVIFAERLWYSPSIWLSLGLALGLHVGMPRFATYRRLAIALVVAALASYSLRTVVRNPDWTDSATIVARDLASLPPHRRSAQLCAFLASFRAAGGDWENAAELLREAITIYPDKALYHQALGRVYLALHEPQRAVAALREALVIDPSRPESTALLKQAEYASAGRDLVAEYEAARAAAQENGNDLAALERWAELAESVDPADAVTAYQLLTTAAPDIPRYWSGLALSQFATGAVEAAAATYERMLTTWPDDWQAHTNLALLLMDTTYRAIHKPEAALTHARRAVELAPTSWVARVNLAEVVARCGDQREAAAMFAELARQSDPGSTEHRLYADRARYLREN